MTTETIQSSAPPQDAPPAYFLSLTVENFRCFGPAQTLDLSRGDNRPAPWTIILGENGVGKTTLLQSVAAFQSEVRNIGIFPSVAGFYEIGAVGPESFMSRQRGEFSKFTLTCLVDAKLRSFGPNAHVVVAPISLSRSESFSNSTASDMRNLICYGYGASRRMGKASLSEKRSEDTSASLFSDDVDLINAEEWLLQADYAASRAPKDSARA